MTKNNLDDGTLETRDGQPPRLKSLISRPKGLPQRGRDAAGRPTCLGEADGDVLGAEIGRHRPIQGLTSTYL